ncbi:MAG: DUF2071 domain-containing protein [Deltaproteobacteria bacterium]|nr:DUF2071 domain-containing protein [Deltaproteobacteria bacterium]
MTHVAFERVDHRPWAVPTAAWTWRQSWRDLLFAHWPIPARELRHLVPEPLAIQEHDGTSWVGLVPFRMAGVMRRPFPDLPWVSAFPELNVRLYVEHEGRPGRVVVVEPTVTSGGHYPLTGLARRLTPYRRRGQPRESQGENRRHARERSRLARGRPVVHPGRRAGRGDPPDRASGQRDTTRQLPGSLRTRSSRRALAPCSSTYQYHVARSRCSDRRTWRVVDGETQSTSVMLDLPLTAEGEYFWLSTRRPRTGGGGGRGASPRVRGQEARPGRVAADRPVVAGPGAAPTGTTASPLPRSKSWGSRSASVRLAGQPNRARAAFPDVGVDAPQRELTRERGGRAPCATVLGSPARARRRAGLPLSCACSARSTAGPRTPTARRFPIRARESASASSAARSRSAPRHLEGGRALRQRHACHLTHPHEPRRWQRW